MTAKQVKAILEFYADIPKQLRLINKEYATLEDSYNPIGGMNMDGMPHSTTVGHQTENMALAAVDEGRGARLREIENRKSLLLDLTAEIATALDSLSSTHKIILTDFYTQGKSWEQISRKIHLSVRQCKNRRDIAIGELGDLLEPSPAVKKFFWKK